MDFTPIQSRSFLTGVKDMIDARGEILALFRYAAAAGNKDFTLYNDFALFQNEINRLPANTNVIVWGHEQLPLRGRVDRAFIDQAIETIPEGAEYLVLCVERTVHDYRPHHYWEWCDYSAGVTHAELIADLEEYTGRRVAVGLWPPWPEQDARVIEAFVPDNFGRVTPGPY